jgi:RecQ family ATP-dependent DNA helicase
VRSRDLEAVLSLLSAHPGGVTFEQLLAELRRGGYVNPSLLRRVIEAGKGRKDIEEWEGRLRTPSPQPSPSEDKPRGTVLPRRIVALDLESVVRLIPHEPFIERRMYQLAAVRLGPDTEWVRSWRYFNAYIGLPQDIEELLSNVVVRRRHSENCQPLESVLAAFQKFLVDVDVVVAYNGSGLDFPLLEREYERTALGSFNVPARADGLYVALALWPVPPRQHRLRPLLKRLGLEISNPDWHNALYDACALSILLEAGSNLVSEWPQARQCLLRSVCRGSRAWDVIFGLMVAPPEPAEIPAAEVAGVLSDALAAKPPMRRARAQDLTAFEFDLPKTVLDDQGHVDVTRLARVVKGAATRARKSQQDMVGAMRGWIVDGRSALVEAPTGTGKSFAMLAVALEWLASSPDHRVIISTFTRQLQRQLADDLQKLADSEVLLDLQGIAAMVKGAANRLSLRALTGVLVEFATDRAAVPAESTPRRALLSDVRFRELAVYFMQRFLATGNAIEEWEAHSVDQADIPPFFHEYCGPQLAVFLHAMSQAASGEMPAQAGTLASHTSTVREELLGHRLIVANHALLFAHLPELTDIGTQTLLLADEAHELEGAATDALSSSVSYQELESVSRESREWLRSQPDRDSLSDVDTSMRELDRFLDHELLPRSAAKAFDTVPRDGMKSHPRAVTVASPYSGDIHRKVMEDLVAHLRTLSQHVNNLSMNLNRVPPRDDQFDQERLMLLREHAGTMASAAKCVMRDAYEALELPWTQAAEDPSSNDRAQDGCDGRRPSAVFPAEKKLQAADKEFNRVVWMAESERPDLQRDGRHYRFHVTTSPIALGGESQYRSFSSTFSRAYYISATLRVAGRWDYMRDRLNLSAASVEAITLPSPFDSRRQARLICFQDFPSWVEHPELAVRTVVHQLTQYGREMVRDNNNGALVLTTARDSAARIAEQLLEQRARARLAFPVSSAPLPLSNQRAVEEFKQIGGFVVGTRGLWQGVDIDNPNRLRLVWINKLPFAAFGDPVIEARRARVARLAEAEGAEDPDYASTERYYLPMAALLLRQAVGRLIRTDAHRGVVVISDRKLATPTRLGRLYRTVFLGSLDGGLLDPAPGSSDVGAGNVVTMEEGWKRIWSFFAREGILDHARALELSLPEALHDQAQVPEIRAIRSMQLDSEGVAELGGWRSDRLAQEVIQRARRVGGYLRLSDEPIDLRPLQEQAIWEIARGRDVLVTLPTGYGKSFIFQLPALILPGVTIVISPLVSLMTDQALALNRTIGGAVRALVGPMRESNSRTGKAEVSQQLTDPCCQHGIRIIYMSPERLCQSQFQTWLRIGVERGIIRRFVFDEAHTFAQWGDDFRPGFRRAELVIRELKETHPDLQLVALTATATRIVREDLMRGIFGMNGESPRRQPDVARVSGNPIRPELAVYRRRLATGEGGHAAISGLLEKVIDTLDDHAIIYCLTIREVEAHYAHLLDYLGSQSDRVRKYHGRLTEVEKSSVANAFKSAPKKGEEGFERPMIIVATSAFGLGIDRPDIRTVFVTSPPPDLAALYQQLGRAGRDLVGTPVGDHASAYALALADSHAFRLIRFMTQKGVASHLLWRIAAHILQSEGLLDAEGLAESLLAEDQAAGRVRREDASARVVASYKAAVLRVLAALAAERYLDDLGDFPARVSIQPGETEPETDELRSIVRLILASGRQHGDPVNTHALYLSVQHSLSPDVFDVGSFWSFLLSLHAEGYLDVSQRANIEGTYLTAVKIHETQGDISPVLLRLEGHQRTLDLEYSYLSRWFGSDDCCNQGFQEYFDVNALPAGTCASAACRCSACWSRNASGECPPPVLEALMTYRPRPSASAERRERRQRRLDDYIRSLLGYSTQGLSKGIIHKVLSGDPMYYSVRHGSPRSLWPELRNSRLFNVRPSISESEIAASIDRLAARHEIVLDQGYWRMRQHFESRGPRLVR